MAARRYEISLRVLKNIFSTRDTIYEIQGDRFREKK